jgi:phenylpropionate dioxygenase-like ring-hydroxylating dioxygenase large terminal subunit
MIRIDSPTESRQGPGYPDGWFQVAFSDEVAPGRVLPCHYFGRELVVFRTASGMPQVLDAYCAHLGAHLGYGGTVTGECIRCPFHAWEYDGDGTCRHIPYSERIPTAARVRSYPTTEHAGLVYAWYSEVGAAPWWEPPDLEEHADPAWTGYRIERYTIKGTPMEITENVFDVPHSQFVHVNAGGTAIPEAEFTLDGHTAEVRTRVELPVNGGKTQHSATMHGLGIVVSRSHGRGSKAYLTTMTPIDPESVEVRFAMMVCRSTEDDPTGEIGLASIDGSLAAFEQDIPIWEHKRFIERPVLCDGDNGVARFRVWSRQFYPDEEPARA